jgi:hypothetical protein
VLVKDKVKQVEDAANGIDNWHVECTEDHVEAKHCQLVDHNLNLIKDWTCVHLV